MTHRSWKLSQIVSLSFIGLMFGFALFGSMFAPGDALMSDLVSVPTAVPGV